MSKCPRCGTPLIIAEPGKLRRWQATIPHLGQHLRDTLTTGALVSGTSVLFVNLSNWGPTGTVLFLGFTAATMRWCAPALVWFAERRTGRDLDGDGEIGKPANTIVIRHGLQKPTPKTWHELDADTRKKDLRAFAVMLAKRQAAKLPKGERAMRDFVLPSRWDMKDALYKEMCGILVKAGVAQKQRRGYRMNTRGGMLAFLADLDRISAERW